MSSRFWFGSPLTLVFLPLYFFSQALGDKTGGNILLWNQNHLLVSYAQSRIVELQVVLFRCKSRHLVASHANVVGSRDMPS